MNSGVGVLHILRALFGHKLLESFLIKCPGGQPVSRSQKLVELCEGKIGSIRGSC